VVQLTHRTSVATPKGVEHLLIHTGNAMANALPGFVAGQSIHLGGSDDHC
jgi:hypothetical protein